MRENRSKCKSFLTMNGLGIRGYFTVEAAMVLPVVIGTIIFIIFLQLYLYDRCLMDQDMAMLAAQAVKNYQGDPEKTQAYLQDWTNQNLTEKYVAWKRDQIVMSKRLDRLKLEQSGTLMTDHALWHADVRYENRILNAAFFLRSCRKSEKLMEEGMS